MITSITPEYEMAAQAVRLRQSLNWFISMALGSALLYAAVAAIFVLPVVAFLAFHYYLAPPHAWRSSVAP